MLCEFQKIYSRPVSLGILAAAILLGIGCSVFFIHNYGYEVHQDGTVFYYDGLQAVRNEKVDMEQVPSVLTVENLNASVRYYHSFADVKTANEAYDRKYPGWRRLFQDTYTSILEDDGNVLCRRKAADDFYDKILEKVTEWTAGYDGILYSEAEKERAVSMLSNVKKPYVNAFFGQWTILLKASFVCFSMLILYPIFLPGQVFSYENDCGMDLVLAPCGKKKLLRMAYRKLGGIFLYLTVVIVLSILAQVLVVFISCGTSGGNNSVQTIWQFFPSLYPMTVWQFFFYSYVLAWVSLLCMAAVSAFLNAWIKNRYLSIACTVFVFILPSVLERTLEKNVFLQRFAFLQPVTGLKVLTYGPSLRTFVFGPFVLRSGDAVLLECIVLLILAYWLAPRIYWKRIRGS